MTGIIEYQFGLRIGACHVHQPVKLFVHHTGSSIRHHLDLPVGYPKGTYAIFTEQHSIVYGIRHINFSIGTGHTIILITDNQSITVAVHSSHRDILHQLTLETQRKVFHIHLPCSHISTQIDRSGRRQVISHFHFISLVQES